MAVQLPGGALVGAGLLVVQLQAVHIGAVLDAGRVYSDVTGSLIQALNFFVTAADSLVRKSRRVKELFKRGVVALLLVAPCIKGGGQFLRQSRNFRHDLVFLALEGVGGVVGVADGGVSAFCDSV